MKVALIQIQSGEHKPSNLTKAESFIVAAAKNKAELILLPEIFNFRGAIDSLQHLAEIAENLSGATIGLIQCLARSLKVNIVAGSIYEKIPQSRKVYNTTVLVNTNGKIVIKYHKQNLFKLNLSKQQINEEKYFLAGNTTTVASVKNFCLGLTICYDLRFPEVFHRCAKKGAHVICIPSAFTMNTGEAHWEVLLRARAIENLAYVLAPNQVGADNRGWQCYGNSMIVDPWGKVLARGSKEKEEIIYGSINDQIIIKSRKKLPEIR